ncbi:MAG: hypothetical protein Kow0079_09420 [Vicingaceae bacterium]
MLRNLVFAVFLFLSFGIFGQATLPLSRTTWDAGTPLGWTDNGTGSYTSSFACSTNNMGQLNSTGDSYTVFFTGIPNQVSFVLKSASMGAGSFCTVEESANGTVWSTLGTHGPGGATPISDCATITYSLNATTRYVRWTYTKTSGNCGLDDVAIDPGCSMASEPATNASNYTFSNIGCNGFTVSWNSPLGNDSSLVVIKAGSDVTTDLVDGTSYIANSTYGSGSDIGTNEFVVYSGSGTSVSITGLTASTTYYINVFEYNGGGNCSNYRTSDEVSASVTTVACDTCPYLTSALINSCDNLPCTEGDNEMLFFNSGNYFVNTAASGITVNYGSTSPASNTYADAFTSNSPAIDSMNADAGCAGKFIDASTVSIIPPNSAFLILNETVCADAFDWSSLCAGVPGNIYVFFSSDATWTSSGQFSNSPPASGRFFRTIIEGCTIDYSYDNALPAGDGATVVWNYTGGYAANYITNGCSLPTTVLPITLLSFTGESKNSFNILNWITSTEINNDYFLIERAGDNLVFEVIGKVSGAGNANYNIHYQFTDEHPINGNNYYRLKQVDFDGKYAYSNIIHLSNNEAFIPYIYYQQNMPTLNLGNELYAIQLFNVNGQLIQAFDARKSIITFDFLSPGIYFVKVFNADKVYNLKFTFQ